MIVVVTGTAAAFPRLVRALVRYHDRHPDEQVWIQHGRADLPPGLAGTPLCSRAEILERMRSAAAVVTHAGCGSILDALSVGHRPVVVARRLAFGEHVNDHQQELVDVLARDGRVISVPDPEDLGALERAVRMAGAARGAPVTPGNRTPLVEALRRDILDLTATRRPRARLLGALGALVSWLPLRAHPAGGPHRAAHRSGDLR